jgi:hypothetical protein
MKSEQLHISVTLLLVVLLSIFTFTFLTNYYLLLH